MEQEYIAIDLSTGLLIAPLYPGYTLEENALLWNPDGTAPYAGFLYSDFDPACYNFTLAFTLVDGVVGFDLSVAKVQASKAEQIRFTGLEVDATVGYSTNQLASQGSLATMDRLPEMQAVLDAVNVLAVDLSANLAAIAAATTVDEINNIVNPPTGIIAIGRGYNVSPLDLNNSFYSQFNSVSLTQADTELYVPGSSTVIPYGSIPGGFDSIGDCFAFGNYLIQIRETATSMVIAEFECPLGANQDISF